MSADIFFEKGVKKLDLTGTEKLRIHFDLDGFVKFKKGEKVFFVRKDLVRQISIIPEGEEFTEPSF
jgi:hypothetical protein